MRGTLPRSIAAAVLGGALALAVLNFLPLSGLISALIALAAGFLVALPLIWKETRLLLHL
jgi:hypothetical protein